MPREFDSDRFYDRDLAEREREQRDFNRRARDANDEHRLEQRLLEGQPTGPVEVAPAPRRSPEEIAEQERLRHAALLSIDRSFRRARIGLNADGTVDYWSTWEQQWIRGVDPADIPDRDYADMTAAERERVENHEEKLQ